MVSIKAPFKIVGGRVATVRAPSTITEQKIVNVLVTSPVERLGITGYGVGVQQYLFEIIDELITTEFQIDAKMELNDRISGATILSVGIEQDPLNETTAILKTVYALPASQPRVAVQTVSLSDFNEESSLY